MASQFPPQASKLPRTDPSVTVAEQLDRLIALLNDYEDHDIAFTGPGVTMAVRHNLARVPSRFEVVWADAEAVIYADTASGWGYQVVYLQSNAAANVRIRLR